MVNLARNYQTTEVPRMGMEICLRRFTLGPDMQSNIGFIHNVVR